MRAPAKELFRDADFPASDSSLFSSFSTPLAQFREDITWRRPQEICATPRLFADNPQEGQVKQGLLGDCWLLVACAALQKSRHLLDQVFPPGQPSWRDHTYRGSFTCRVWQFGRWVEVTIDDRLPCLAGRLCFSRCQREDVFWLPLLEKVYAKVYGAYEHLWAGQVADALVDLTGGLAERWSLKDSARSSGQQDRPGGSERGLCQQLLSLKDRCPISCSVLSPRDGARELGEFHAFIVSDLRELQGRAGQSVLLLRIRNPWGRRCWQGPWRQGGEGWSRVDPADESELLSQLQEGEFWVEEEEFLREFDEVTVGFPITEAGHLQSLYSEKALCHTQELPGAWVKGQSAGGCRNNSGFPSNPKFWLRVSEPSEVFVAVLQRPRVRPAGRARAPVGDECAAWSPASFRREDYQAVGLHIWKVEKRRVSLPRVLSTPPVAGTVCHAYDREVHLRCELAPGYYLAVPSTFLKDVPGQFLLRVFSSGRVSLSAIKPAAGSPAPGEALPAGEWETVQLRGSWRTGQTAGGSRNFASYPSNPCFPLSVPEGPGPRCVRVTLHQHCQDSQCHPIGFHIFQNCASCPGDPMACRTKSCPRATQPRPSCAPHPWAALLGSGHQLGGRKRSWPRLAGQSRKRRERATKDSVGSWQTDATECSCSFSDQKAVMGGMERVLRPKRGQYVMNASPNLPPPQPAHCAVLQVPVDGGSQGAPGLLLQEPVVSCVPHRYAQEVSRLCHLSPGTYRVVPSTYLPDTEGAFAVTIATRIDRRSIHSQERLGQLLQEASFMAVMKT